MTPTPLARPRTLVWPLLAACAAVIVGGGLVAASQDEASTQLVLILAIAATLGGPLVIRAVTGRFDLFEPILVFVIMWGLMFVARPLVMRETGHTWLRETYNIEAGITRALVVGLVAAVAFVAAYEYASRKARRPRKAKTTSLAPPPPLVVPAMLAFVGLAVMGTLRATGTFHEVTTGASAYTYFAPLLTIPAIVLLLRRGALILALALLAFSVFGFLQLGQRAFVIWPVSAVFIYWYMSRPEASKRRPSLAVIAIVAALFLPLFTVLEVAREEQVSVGTALVDDSTRDIGASIERFTEGDTTAMFPALALQLMTENVMWTQKPGYWLYSTPTRLIPSSAWPGKPLGSTELLYTQYFPENYRYNKAGTLFTLASEFYFDLGFPGVILGMGLVGWACARLWAWVTAHRDDPWAWALYAPFFGLALVMFRGDVGLAFGLALFVFGPLLGTYAAMRGADVALKETARPAQ